MISKVGFVLAFRKCMSLFIQNIANLEKDLGVISDRFDLERGTRWGNANSLANPATMF